MLPWPTFEREGCVYRVRATLWVDLRDWEGGRVQHIDFNFVIGKI